MRVRINNIGAEPAWSLDPKTKEPSCEFSIVKYHPNGYYGELEHYLKSGWEDKGNTIYSNHCNIDKKCFLDKETHYVIAFLKYDPKSNATHLASVADRLLYIGENEKADFFEVYKIADKMLLEKAERDEKTNNY